MLTNSKMTHYAKTLNTTTRLEEWTGKVYKNVLWQGGKGSSLNKGYVDRNDVKVRIPYDAAKCADFKIGDIIVKGEHKKITSQSDLEDTYNITSIVDNSFSNLKHIHIEGK